ncbi:MAG: UDP-N-acetylmuramoyl-L-alanyl-D-glutamate--2,6-diaminopimelate ligase [Erysipelotrichia bacterium]|nr:UDP-N-acetylmuramoyl-L-alanyl-D-glutamate--2,6-diaminopimelate ligase [Erysipelotrichia bacterium]
MDISEIFENAPHVIVENIMTDSRKKSAKSIFFCIVGLVNDGHDYVQQAIDNGAICIVHSKDFEKYYEGITYLKVEDTLEALNLFASRFYGDVTKNMKVYGVTGTNGKTTIAWIIRYLVSRFHKCGYIGTIGYMWDEQINDTFLTTPDIEVLHKMLKEIYDHGCRNVSIEVSSQGLDLRRVEAVKFDYAIFSNLTHDHLDYHGTMENYYNAKAKLFKMIGTDKKAIINVDDSYGQRLIDDAKCQCITYALKNNADYMAKNIHLFNDHSSFDLVYGNNNIHIETNLVAEFNIYNLLAVLATLIEDGYKIEELLPYLNSIPQVLGRAEKIDCGQNFNVLVDYAHTPDGYEKIFEYIKAITKKDGRIITVFGAHGARDHKKRPMIGKIVDDNSDVIILCSEDNHWENPYEICCEIATGITKHPWLYIEDRYDAIRQGLELANKDDTVCILGKADEQYFKIGDGKVYWMGDNNAAKEILTKMLKGEEQ